MSDTTPSPDFKVGLALAGAISAGAYTAGVIDFLILALEEWEKRRGEPDVPRHRTGIKVVTGASAGAITGAIGVVALARGPNPQPLTTDEIARSYRDQGRRYGSLRCVLPQLYETWVTRPRMVAAGSGVTNTPGLPDFLSLEDLVVAKSTDDPQGKRQPRLGSLLNSTRLDGIKDAALQSRTPSTPAPPRPYLAAPLHLYMTISNLRGIPFRLSFGGSSYGMQTHGDRVHYEIAGVGSWYCEPGEWLSSDSKVPIDVATLPSIPGQNVPEDWDAYGTAALASAAFPIGLASRPISGKMAGYHKRSYPLDVDPANIIPPAFPGETANADPYHFLNVDGGLINNNPYDYAEYALLGWPAKRLPPRDRTSSDLETEAAVIVIAPFPDPPAFLPQGQPEPELWALIRALLPTLMTQARFRPAELAKAIDPTDYSRYLISPIRTLPDGHLAQYAIACGALGGFGGFLDEKFRAHDFQLGRRNCQQFLSKVFGLPVGGRVLGGGGSVSQRIAARASDGSPEQDRVVPLFGEAQAEVALPHWPRMTSDDFETLMRRVRGRLDAVLPVFVRSHTASWRLRALAWIAQRFGTDRAIDAIRSTILAELIRRDQIEDWTLPAPFNDIADDARAVFAELIDSRFDYRTAPGIARSTHLTVGRVSEIITLLERESGRFQVVAAPWDRELFVLRSRQPGWLTRAPVIGRLTRAISEPTRDPPQ